MPEVESECTFETKADQIQFKTQTNGDEIRLRGIHLTQGQATSMAWLVNAPVNAILEIQVRVKV